LGVVLCDVIMPPLKYEHTEEVNVLLSPNIDIKAFLKSDTGADYPVVRLEIK
jgi:hypothetical protein